MTQTFEASVVIATYNRAEALVRLLQQLAVQTVRASAYEVVVVDDGSREPVQPFVDAISVPYALRLIRQQNGGAAVARHRGVLEASGDVLVILDDDMQIGDDFLAEHLKRHEPGTRRVVLGRMLPAEGLASMPLFERWHARMLDVMADDLRTGKIAARGNHLLTGNVSMRRADYLAVGGFDASLGHSEDAELGLRLEKTGVTFEFSETAKSVHGSDHTSLQKWRARAEKYGIFDRRIARKHADLPHADPWRYLFQLNPVSRPLMAATVLAPELSRFLPLVVYGTAAGLGAIGLERAAIAGATLAYGLDYFRGLRKEVGALPLVIQEVLHNAAQRMDPADRVAVLSRLAEAIREDQRTMQHYENKYGHAAGSEGALGSDIVQKIGLQELAAYRTMRALHEAGVPLAAKVVSRLIRHLYGSDIHWEAQLAPGVMLVHGMGLAISREARVAAGCILFQNVTLGMGTDPETRVHGAPTIEANVHIGPGATLLGPITVGAGTKIMAGAVLNRSVPPGSLVAAVASDVRRREAPQQRPAGPALDPAADKP